MLKSPGIKTHGLKHHPLYEVWHHMKQRCNGTSNHQANIYYHKRGIRYDLQWEIFINFYNDMVASYIPGLQLDRIDNDKGYCKENCRWVTCKVNNNNRSNSIKICHQGETKTIKEWSEHYDLDYQTIIKRWSYYKIRTPDKLFYMGNLSHSQPQREIKPCTICGRLDGTLRPDGLPRRSKEGLCNTCDHRNLMRKRRSAAGYLGLAGDMED